MLPQIPGESQTSFWIQYKLESIFLSNDKVSFQEYVRTLQAWGRLQIDDYDYEYDYKQFLNGDFDYDYDYTKLEVADYDYDYDYSTIRVS